MALRLNSGLPGRLVELNIRAMPSFPALRNDGRDAASVRQFRVDWDPMGFALSSLIVRTGRTAVLCSVSLEEGVPAGARERERDG